MPKYQATAYIRLSYTVDRSSESDSVTNQRKLIENFIERNPDIQIVSEKIDDGYSGIIFDRPAFKEMMQDITDGKINCVIVKDLSRLGREYIETGRYLRRVFPTYGVRFIAIQKRKTQAIKSILVAWVFCFSELYFFVVCLTYGCRRLCTFKLSGKLPSRRIFLNRNVNVPGTIGSPPGCRNR